MRRILIAWLGGIPKEDVERWKSQLKDMFAGLRNMEQDRNEWRTKAHLLERKMLGIKSPNA